MISDIDIKDWEMLTTPLKLKELKEGDIFSVFGDNKVLEVMHVLTDIVYAETKEIWNALVLPRDMEVFPWVIKQKTKASPTDN